MASCHCWLVAAVCRNGYYPLRQLWQAGHCRRFMSKQEQIDQWTMVTAHNVLIQQEQLPNNGKVALVFVQFRHTCFSD